ncbi:MAG: hypothetical protein IPL72_18975 [Sulfuritalea sp.]|nr:hypothetical protein [Sulfuritalea sp.]
MSDKGAHDPEKVEPYNLLIDGNAGFKLALKLTHSPALVVRRRRRRGSTASAAKIVGPVVLLSHIPETGCQN